MLDEKTPFGMSMNAIKLKSEYGCDRTLLVRLYLRQGSSIEDISSNELAIYLNPIKRGNSVVIGVEFSVQALSEGKSIRRELSNTLPHNKVWI